MLWFLQNTPGETYFAMLCFKLRKIHCHKIKLTLFVFVIVLVLFWQLKSISSHGLTVRLSHKKQILDDNIDVHVIKTNVDHVKIPVSSPKGKVMFDGRQNTTVKGRNGSSEKDKGQLSSEKEHLMHAVKKESSVLLLMWTHPWGVSSEGPKEGWKSGNCSFTYKREFLEEADAVIFPYMTAPRTWSLPRWNPC